MRSVVWQDVCTYGGNGKKKKKKRKEKEKEKEKRKEKNPKQMKSAVRRMYIRIYVCTYVRMYVCKVSVIVKIVYGYVFVVSSYVPEARGCTVTRMRDAESKPVRK